MKIRVCVAGGTGWIGRPLCEELLRTNDIQLVSVVSRSQAGRPYENSGLIVDRTVTEALQKPADVLVDYTHPESVKRHTLESIRKGVAVVIGTSGLRDKDYAEIQEAALRAGVGVIAGGNFAITAALLLRFACEAAKYLNHWEVIDYASSTKPDAPSGMTRELAYRLSQIKKPAVEHPIEKTVGSRESRGVTLNDTQIHSLRLPGFVIGAEVLFGEKDERLSIHYDAGAGAEPYIPGTLLAIRKVREHKGLVRGLDQLLF